MTHLNENVQPAGLAGLPGSGSAVGDHPMLARRYRFGLWDGSRLPTSTERVAIGARAEPRQTIRIDARFDRALNAYRGFVWHTYVRASGDRWR